MEKKVLEKRIKQGFAIPESDLEAFRERCKENDTSMSREVRKMIKAYTHSFSEGWVAQAPDAIKRFLE